jgi:group II intron reverse transcriptase/maturase
MRFLKSNPIFNLLNSYLIDVRCEMIASVRFSRNSDCHYIRTSVELGNEEISLLNIASPSEGLGSYKRTDTSLDREVSIMVKATLPEDQFQVYPKIGKPFCRNGWFFTQVDTNLLSIWMTVIAHNIINITNEMNDQPKVEYRPLQLTTRLPKGSNPYGNGVVMVPGQISNKRFGYELGNTNWKGYTTASNPVSVRKYSTDVHSAKQAQVFEKLDSLTILCANNKDKVIDRKIYKILCDPLFLQFAYNNIKSNPGNMTPGITPETLDGIDWPYFEDLSKSLKNESFYFKPGRRINIDKASGGKRPLTIAPPRDKIVQEAIKIILNSIFEPTFLDNSHGFRPNRSCHTALKFVMQKFMPVTWAIEGDISKCFDNVDHHKLMHLIELKIKDQQFNKLIWKSLRAGYYVFKIRKTNIVGTPQGSIISPILSNIFLHQLDVFVHSLKTEFDKGNKPKLNKEYNHITYLIQKAKNSGETYKVRNLVKHLRKIPAIDTFDREYRRLCYVRYADDWVIGVRGSIKETQEILSKVIKFCSEIGLTVNETKTKITNLNKSKAKFLGVSLSRSKHTKYRIIKNVISRQSRKLRLEVPISDIKNRLRTASFLKGDIPNPKFLWYPLEHKQIITLYNAVLRGFINYFGFVHNYSRFAGYCYMVLKFSCAKLLSAKFKIKSMKSVFLKFGPDLAYKDKNGKVFYFFKPSWKVNTNRFLIDADPEINALYADKISLAKLDSLSCKVCDSKVRVEMHHIRKMSDLNPKLSKIDKLMVKANRKQIPLCRECHMKLHPTRR